MARRLKIPRLALEILAVVVAGYLGALVGLSLNQSTFVYHPNLERVSPSAMGLTQFQAVEIRTPDGERIVGWWAPPAHANGGVILYLHGKGGHLADRASRFRDLSQEGFGLLGVDWRGYGGSTGKPSEAGLNTDALAAYDWIHAQAPGAKIVVFGESLGTGPAVTLATHRPVAGVVLDSAYASILRLANWRLPVFPNSFFLKDRYASEDRIAHIHAPLLMVHCDEDGTIPIAEARRLFAAAAQPKELLVLHGCGHVQTWGAPFRSRLSARLHAWFGPAKDQHSINSQPPL
jgi:hypothetical protein